MTEPATKTNSFDAGRHRISPASRSDYFELAQPLRWCRTTTYGCTRLSGGVRLATRRRRASAPALARFGQTQRSVILPCKVDAGSRPDDAVGP